MSSFAESKSIKYLSGKIDKVKESITANNDRFDNRLSRLRRRLHRLEELVNSTIISTLEDSEESEE